MFDPIRQRRAFDKLQHQRPCVAGFFQPVDRADVGVVERRQHLRFTLEAGQPFGITGKGVRQHLDRHVPVEGRVPGTVDLAHAAFADLGGDGIGAEGGAGFKRHRSVQRDEALKLFVPILNERERRRC